MKPMLFGPVLLAAILCRELKSQVVVGNNIEFAGGTGGNFSIKTYLNFDRGGDVFCGAECIFTYDQFQYQDGMLTVVAPGLPPPTRSYYLANYGDVFRETEAVNFGQLPPINTGGRGDFYMAIATAFVSPPKNFGWIHLQRSGSDIVMLGNAIAYNARGIIIGTDIAVPEPTTAALTHLFTAILSQTRVRRRRGMV
jgi:hypothetical protein